MQIPWNNPDGVGAVHMEWHLTILTAIVVLAAPSARALTPAEVLILVNRDVRVSSEVAKMYQGDRKSVV